VSGLARHIQLDIHSSHLVFDFLFVDYQVCLLDVSIRQVDFVTVVCAYPPPIRLIK